MSGRSRRLHRSRLLLGALVLVLGLVGTTALDHRCRRCAAAIHAWSSSRTTAARHNFLCPPFEAALRSTGVSGKIISPDEREDPVATLSLLATQGYDLIVVDIFWSDILAQVAPEIPEGALRHHRRCAQPRARPAQERPGGRPAHERGGLPRGLARRRDGEAPRRAATSSASSAGVQLPGRRRFHRRFHGRRAARLAARSRARDTPATSPIRASARRSRAARSRAAPGWCSTSRAPAARHAAGRQAGRRVGHRSRHRPVGPRPSHPHERRQALRRRHAHAARAGARRAASRAGSRLRSRSATTARRWAASVRRCPPPCAPRLDALARADRRGRDCAFRESHRTSRRAVVLDGDPHQPARHGDVLGRAPIGILASTSPVAGSSRNEGVASPRGHPHAAGADCDPARARAGVRRAQRGARDGIELPDLPVSPAPTHTADRSRAIAATNVPA